MTYTLYNRGRAFEFTNKAYRKKFVKYVPEPDLYPEFKRKNKCWVGSADWLLLNKAKLTPKPQPRQTALTGWVE